MRADKKKFSTRLMAALMAGTLAAGMMGMNVSAAGVHSGNPITTIPVTKNVLTDGNTIAPNTTFEFEVAVADAGTFNDRNKNQFEITNRSMCVFFSKCIRGTFLLFSF